MVMVNGYKTYSKTPFSEKKHPRESGGTFTARVRTEEDDVDYHYDFDKSSHPRGKDGAFTSNASHGVKLGYERYGTQSEKPSNGTGSGYGGYIKG